MTNSHQLTEVSTACMSGTHKILNPKRVNPNFRIYSFGIYSLRVYPNTSDIYEEIQYKYKISGGSRPQGKGRAGAGPAGAQSYGGTTVGGPKMVDYRMADLWLIFTEFLI